MTTSHFGIGLTGTILVAVLLLNSCSFVDWRESVERGEIYVEFPRGELNDPGKGFMALPDAPDCWDLYNQPEKHREWAECMGVEYR